MSGLANTRAFGDKQSKRLGVSAEPEIRRVELGPAEHSFLVLVSDGVSGTLSDQEIVDIVKEAKTPEQGAKDVVSFALTCQALYGAIFDKAPNEWGVTQARYIYHRLIKPAPSPLPLFQ